MLFRSMLFASFPVRNSNNCPAASLLCTAARLLLLLSCVLTAGWAVAGEDGVVRDLRQSREAGRQQSALLKSAQQSVPQASAVLVPQADLVTYREQVAPVLQRVCVQCHGADEQKGNIRVDTLNPDLLHGPDVSWWQEVSAVVSKQIGRAHV